MSNVKMPVLYRAFKSYVRFLVEKVYYRRTYYINKDKVPVDGTSLLVVSDHQNSMNDALGILMSIEDRVVHFIVRADVFALSKFADKFLRSIGLLPAFRLNWEGEEALQNNGATFRDSEKSLLEGSTVVIFPEAGHQDKHWLGTFSYGYTKMAFDAAEMGNFEKEIFILPSCNHYSDYNGLRTDMLVKYGTPISLKPYYELYKTKPRTAQREVNALVREQIKGMMLSIDDLEHYEAIDYIRQCPYGQDFARTHGLDPEELPQKLDSDKKLVAALAEAFSRDNAGMSEIYGEALSMEKAVRDAGIREQHLEAVPGMGNIVAQLAVLLALAPLAVFALWPALPAWFIPKYFADRAEDKMFSGTFVIALNALFIFPVFGIVTFIITLVNSGFVAAVAYVALFPALCLFEWAYARWIREFIQDVKAVNASKSGLLAGLRKRREALYVKIDKIIGK